MNRNRACGIIASLAIVVVLAGGRVRAEDKPPWDAKTAGQYLDERATEWAKFGGANRGKGADKVSCVSCHTILSYALGRPAARHLGGEDHPTAQEDRMLEHVRRRGRELERTRPPRGSSSPTTSTRGKKWSRGVPSRS